MIQHNISLEKLNTFNLPAVAERYLALTDLRQLEGPDFRQAPQLVLGGGSNMVLLERVPGLTVHVRLGGVTILGADAGAGAGLKRKGTRPTDLISPTGATRTRPTDLISPTGTTRTRPTDLISPTGTTRTRPTDLISPTGTTRTRPTDLISPTGATRTRPTDLMPPASAGDEYPSDGEYDEKPIPLRVGAGVDWNQLVRYTLDRGWYGLENLILIPGTVGAAPVQNIGAYGAEVAERITAVHVWEYGVGAQALSPEDCAFGYRDSRFKREPGRFLITAVDFRLNGKHKLKTGYGAIQEELARLAIDKPSPADVALAVTNIRRAKLPDWFFLGNSGSFFKNPVVPIATHRRLLPTYEDLPSYPIDEGHVKLPAGWLIDRAGLKGTRHGNVGTYAKQALVLVNHGGASGRDIIAFSTFIQKEVQAKFGVALEREVQMIGGA
jgi:UDP-N-acetylmuramate dehydrogenase